MAALLALVGAAGCEWDSYIDPSVAGRWENTPTVLPILKRIDVIDEPEEQIAGLSQPTSEDLIPEIAEYVMGPGDLITVSIFELITPGVESVQTRRIDEVGNIRIQVVGELRVSGLTTKQLEQRIVDILDPDILKSPTVSVIVQEGRQRTFNVIGAANAVGTYTLLQPNFRLLDALSLARGVQPGTKKVHVIRQVPLADIVREGQPIGVGDPGAHRKPMRPSDAPPTTPQPVQPVDPSRLIDDLTNPDAPAPPPVRPGPATEQPLPPQPSDVLIPPQPVTLAAALQTEGSGGSTTRWVNIDGKWVKVAGPDPAAAAEPTPPVDVAPPVVPLPPTAPTQPGPIPAPIPGGPDVNPLLEGTLPPANELFTQRVIEIDAEKLLEGVATWNIVVRPGDIIRVPLRETGNVYIGGEINRPGTYVLPGENELTLKQLITSAGGLGPLAIPERIDLIRRIDDDHEATVRLNGRAIYEGVQPDFFLKPNDQINIGTNFWAAPLAVVRNSFRMSYGFGFLLDRNFGFDVFGPQNNNNGN